MFKYPERFALERGEDGGAFRVPGPVPGRTLNVIASHGEGWEHVSVSIAKQPEKTPTWIEMNFVKDLFWDEEDAVMQLHPPKSTWVNNYPGCLHLWRPIGQTIPLPPQYTVGVPGYTYEQLKALSYEERAALTDKRA